MKKIIHKHISEKKKINLKLVTNKLITMKRKRVAKSRKPFIKTFDDVIVDSDEDIIKKSLLFQSFHKRNKQN